MADHRVPRDLVACSQGENTREVDIMQILVNRVLMRDVNGNTLAKFDLEEDLDLDRVTNFLLSDSGETLVIEVVTKDEEPDDWHQEQQAAYDDAWPAPLDPNGPWGAP